MLTRNIKRNDEELVVEVSEDNKRATVTDERGTTVTISYDSGNLNVRLPNGWGILGFLYGSRPWSGQSSCALSQERN